MDVIASSRREITHSQFGDHAIINQGDIHYYITHQQPPIRPSGPIRVIPYPRNEDVVYRQELVERLDALLPPTPEFGTAALWGLGGSG